jgi:hypothetical protein
LPVANGLASSAARGPPLAREDPLFTELIATRMILLNLLKPLAMGQVVTPEDFTRISATVRSDKRKVAQEIQQQYITASPKEL